MSNVTGTKSFLIYFPPSPEVSDLLEKVNMQLREKHPSNTYLPIYQGKWHSHLMVYLSPMPTENQSQIIEAVKKLSSTLTAFKVQMSDLEIADSNYLYVQVNSEARNLLENIHNQLVELLAPYRDATIKGKYLLKWDSFSEEEKYRIKTTGLPYKYVPHMTLGVFKDRQEQEEAYKEALPFKLSGRSFIANRVEIMTSVGADYKDKEIVFSEKISE